MPTIPKSLLNFLKELAKNNDKAWFDDHRSLYKELRSTFKTFMIDLTFAIGEFDQEIIDTNTQPHLFRINRDVRFSNNKTPYKTNFGGFILPGGRKAMHNQAGYYVHIEPGGNSFLAGGAYLPPREWLGTIRNHICDKPTDFKKVINSKNFKEYFDLEGAQLKTAPRGYSKDHPEIELLRYKSLIARHCLKDSDVTKKDFSDHAIKAFKQIYPFNKFLNATKW